MRQITHQALEGLRACNDTSGLYADCIEDWYVLSIFSIVWRMPAMHAPRPYNLRALVLHILSTSIRLSYLCERYSLSQIISIYSS